MDVPCSPLRDRPRHLGTPRPAHGRDPRPGLRARILSLAELSETLGISAATARRDLSDLADQNLVLRTHGGVSALERGHEIPVALRDTRFKEAKRAIAKAMVQRLPSERHVIALSGGTTTASVARELANHRDIAVVTNSLTIANLLSGYAGVRIVMTGGFLRPKSLELVGALAESTFNAVNVGTAILGADGISASSGVTTHDETEARTNRAMVAKAQRTVVVADGSKIGAVALAQMADIEQVAMLITDNTADPPNSTCCARPASRSSSSTHMPSRTPQAITQPRRRPATIGRMRHTPRYLMEDPEEVKRLIRGNAWATFVSPASTGLVASHYPVILDEEREELTIISHFGRPDEVPTNSASTRSSSSSKVPTTTSPPVGTAPATSSPPGITSRRTSTARPKS